MQIKDIIIPCSGGDLRKIIYKYKEENPEEMYLNAIGPGKEFLVFNIAKETKFKGHYNIYKGVNKFGEIRNVYLNRDYSSDSNLKASEIMMFKSGSLCEEDENELKNLRVQAIIAAKKNRRNYMFQRSL